MLELRLLPDAKRIAALRASIAQECTRSKVDPTHAELVATVTEELILGAGPRSAKRVRRAEVFVVVTVQSDSTMLMVRDTKPVSAELDEYRLALLDEHTVTWSTISGTDGRTIWAEISRRPAPKPTAPAAEPAEPAPAPLPTRAEAAAAESRRAPIPA